MSAQMEGHVVSLRGYIIENTHKVHAAVVDSEFNILFTLGNPGRLTFPRSAAKPFQALAIIETGALEKYDFDAGDLALVCGSHSGEERHIARGRSMLAKVGAEESDLCCGGHDSLSPELNREWIRKGFKPTPLYNDCSGKHVATIAGTKVLGGDVKNYDDPENPMTLKTKQVFSELSSGTTQWRASEDKVHELTDSGVHWSIDGCNLQTPALSLYRLSRMYALLAAADSSSSSERTRALARIYQAMEEHPEMIAGERRFCTELISAYKGILVSKNGADGCYAVAIKPSEQTRLLGAKGGIGFSIKVEDGSTEIAHAVVVEILQQLGIGTPEIWRKLDKFHYLKRLSTTGKVIGEVGLPFKLRKCQ